MKLYMAVTADKYELPIFVEESQRRLSEKLGRNRRSVTEEFSRMRRGVYSRCNGKLRGYILKEVEISDDTHD